MKKLLVSFVLMCGMSLPAHSAEVTIRAISAWPTTYEFTRQFMKFVDRVNEAGKGVVQIKLIGGPEVTPAAQQDMAIRKGVFDMQLGAASYYNGVVPEADALFGANILPPEARKSGATAVLDKIWRKKLNAHLVAWQSGGLGFHLFLSSKPKFTNDKLDLHGLRLRSASAYKQWFNSMGATNVMLSSPEVFSAFQRGMIQGLGSPSINFTDMGIDKYVRYRIDPKVWQLDILIIMNAEKWDALPSKAQKIITDAATEHEIETDKTYKEAEERESAKLKSDGVKFVQLTGKRRELYVSNAYDTIWHRLKKNAPEDADELRKLFYKQ